MFLDLVTFLYIIFFKSIFVILVIICLLAFYFSFYFIFIFFHHLPAKLTKQLSTVLKIDWITHHLHSLIWFIMPVKSFSFITNCTYFCFWPYTNCWHLRSSVIQTGNVNKIMHNLNVLTLTVPNKLAKLINLPQSDGAKCNLRSNSSTVSVLHCKILLKETTV